jgi:predicted GIY-YIG superfamily endonuclease
MVSNNTSRCVLYALIRRRSMMTRSLALRGENDLKGRIRIKKMGLF